MEIAIRVFNYVWFNTFGYEEHVQAKGKLAVDDAHRAARKEHRDTILALYRLDPREAPILR